MEDILTLQEVVENSTYQDIMCKPMRNNKGKLSRYYNLCQYADGNRFGVYNLAIYVDSAMPKDQRNVYVALYKCPVQIKADKVFFSGNNNKKVFNCAIPYQLWDNNRAVIIGSIFAMAQNMAYRKMEEYSLTD